MAGTTVQADLQYDPDFAHAPRVWVRQKWSDNWEPAPALKLVHARLATAAHGESTMELRWSYGSISQPWELTYSTVESVDLAGWYVRLDLVGPDGETTQWVGKLFSVPREIEGADVVRSGEQVFIAYGPQTLLDRVHVHESWWDGNEAGQSESDPIKLAWMPGINAKDDRGLLVGNRSEDLYGDTYLYGTEAEWTYRQYVEYLLAKWADESGRDDPGPAWRLAGQADLLNGLTAVVELETVESVGALIRRLISPRYGCDYLIRYVDTDDGEPFDGFELLVYALLAEEIQYAGQSLPHNPYQIRYRAGASHWQRRTVVEERHEQLFHTLRIIGRRAVICASLGGENCTVTQIAGTLEGKWATALETAYEAGAGVGILRQVTAEEHDQARRDVRYDPVYQVWAAPAGWDQAAHETLYACDHKGHYRFAWILDDDPPPHQLVRRKTLDWTPLQKGLDYSTDPATDQTPEGHTVDFEPPCVWLWGYAWSGAGALMRQAYQRADQVGVGVSALRHDWGVKLSASPNHLVAEDSFNPPMTRPTKVKPRYDDSYMVATVAFEADGRPMAEIVLDADDAHRPSDGIMTIYDDTIEVWILAPHTVVGTDPATGDLVTSGSYARVLREDIERLHLVMAGAIARHQRARARAEITAEGLLPWGNLLGYVLQAVEEAGDTHTIQAPLTCVEWRMDEDGNGTTVIRTGFAGSEFQD